MIPDTIAGLVSIFSADAELQALVGFGTPLTMRVYGYKLRRSESDSQPRKAIVIRPAGGQSFGGYQPLIEMRVDIFCYGETESEASKVLREVHQTMYLLERTKDSDRLIYNAQHEAGPNYAVDPDVEWPMFWESWIVKSSRVSAA